MDIYISRKKIVTQFECGSRVSDFPLLIKKNGSWGYLSDSKVDEKTENVTFYIKRWYGWSKLAVPQNYQRATVLFLQMFHNSPKMNFDCYSFVSLVAELPLHQKEWADAFWDTRKVSGSITDYGVIFFVNEDNQEFAHAALHIGRGYFLSIQGAGGMLSVSSLQDLQDLYREWPDLLVATPRGQAEIKEALAAVASV